MRKARSFGASCEATCVGVKKNTRLDWNAFITSATATPNAATPAAIHNARLVLGFKLTLLVHQSARPRAADPQRNQFEHQSERGRPVRHPEVELRIPHARALTQRVRRSRSRMIVRTRTSAAPI